MQVKKITVTKLFGIFTHIIPMKLDDRITIIHGPNGFGKTAILRMIDGLFNARQAELRSIPFRSFKVEFADKSVIQVDKTVQRSGVHTLDQLRANTKLTYKFTKPGSKPKTFSPPSFDADNGVHFPTQIIDDLIPDIERIGSSTWKHYLTNEILSVEDVLERYGEFLPSHYFRTKDEPEWLKKIRQSIDVHLVQTQRLFSLGGVSRPSRKFEKRPTMALTVAAYSEELTQAIQTRLAEYAALSQTLDRSFPARLVKEEVPVDLTKNELRGELTTLEKKRLQLMAAGLLDKRQGVDFQIPKEIQDRTRDVLSVYVKDVDKKLSVFDEIANKIDLFKGIINSRFLYKQMAVSRDKGFTFTTSDGQPLAPGSLSSGEQHELVLFYALLFKVKPNSLILIDEPEISLHVAWQEQFLKDLQEITKLSSFDILIATHSPQIIHDRWDLTVELTGPA